MSSEIIDLTFFKCIKRYFYVKLSQILWKGRMHTISTYRNTNVTAYYGTHAKGIELKGKPMLSFMVTSV